MRLTNILEVEILGIDFMGPFPHLFENFYILLAVEYVSKWIEAIAISKNDAKTLVKFILKNILTRIGDPRCILSYEKAILQYSGVFIRC